jgi:hypothetical protein
MYRWRHTRTFALVFLPPSAATARAQPKSDAASTRVSVQSHTYFTPMIPPTYSSFTGILARIAAETAPPVRRHPPMPPYSTSFTGILTRVAATDSRQLTQRTRHVLPSTDQSSSPPQVVLSPNDDTSNSSTSGSTSGSSTHQSSDSRTDADWDADFETTLATGDVAAVNRFCSLVPFTTWCALSGTWLRSARRAGATEAVRVLRGRGAAWSPATTQDDAECAAVIEQKRRLREADNYADDDNTVVPSSPVGRKKKCFRTV